jgi:hypothetical protein
MAITDNATACAVNTLLRWVFPSLVDYGKHPTQAEALKAAESLAGKAHKQLMAGVSSSGVRRAADIDGTRLAAIDTVGKH